MFDLMIRHGSLVASTGIEQKSIGVAGGRVTALIEPGESAPARETIEAEGMLIFPGLVDAHVHFREPGLIQKEDFASGSRAAAAGGVTTVMVMPTDKPMTTTPEAFLEKKALADAKSHVDYALQAGLGPDTRYVRELADLGAVSFEIFLADLAPPMLVDRSADLLACLAAVRAAGGVVGITPGDDSIVQTLSAEAQAKYPTDRLAFARARPPIAEAIGIARACLAVAETCCRAHVRQVSCALGVAVIEALAPSMLSSEVTIHNLLLEEQEIERLGPIAKVVPPLRPRSDLAALLAALRGGTIKIVATDHAPHLPEEKQAGNIDIWKAPGGFPGVQTLLPLMLGLAGDGAISLPDLVRVCCETPARLFGLHPRKGTLAVGADADIVVVDPRRPFTVRNQDQESKAKLTPFDGWTVPMTPVAAFLRGRIVMRDGRPVGAPSGRFLAPAR